MENERLTFEQVCEQYEFADWELAELVEQGKIQATQDQEGKMWFSLNAIVRFFRATPCHFFSLEVAGRVYGKAPRNLKQQAKKGVLQAKKISDRWAVNAQRMDNYMENHARG